MEVCDYCGGQATLGTLFISGEPVHICGSDECAKKHSALCESELADFKEAGLVPSEAAALKSPSPTPRIVIFASEGLTRSVVVQGLPCAVDCVVVDYDDRQAMGRDIPPEDFERELLGCTREEFDRSGVQYVW